MATRPPVQRLPWRRILVALATAVVIAWSLGFGIGLVVRFGAGLWW